MDDDTTRSIRESYDRLAEEYARRLFNELQHKPLDRELLNRFARVAAPHGSLCDMGCGPGQVARYLRDAGAAVFGLDLSPRMLQQARILNPDISFREGNMLALDLQDRSLAGIAAFYAIVNLPQPSLPLAFREMERVLQPGGRLLLAFHIGDEALHEDALWGQPISMEFFLFPTPVIRNHLEAAGLAIEEIIERDPMRQKLSIRAEGHTFLPGSLTARIRPGRITTVNVSGRQQISALSPDVRAVRLSLPLIAPNMKAWLPIAPVLLAILLLIAASPAQLPARHASYLGFDRNDYPGDANLKILRQTFSYTGYWLNDPPGSRTNSWTGKRKTLQAAGFGFLVLFNGRTYAEIRRSGDPSKLGNSDAAAAVRAARAEGFPPQTIIFLDQEQGGRLLPEQRDYLHAWIDGVNAAHFDSGVYCSGIAAPEGSGVSIITADDLRKNAGGRQIKYWVVNDSCPPSPGCTVSTKDLSPATSGISFADVWQFAQSPRRPDFASGCPANYGKDGNCYPPAVDPALKLHVDLDVATSADPSHGRTRD